MFTFKSKQKKKDQWKIFYLDINSFKYKSANEDTSYF